MTQTVNQFSQSPELGQVDLRFSSHAISVQIDDGVSESDNLVAGQAVKIVDEAGGIPKVVPCEADSDEVLGFINYDIKSQEFAAGDRAEISQAGNCMYLQAAGAIARGAQVVLDYATDGQVKALSGNEGAKIVGWALDKGASSELLRVMLTTPSFEVY